MGFVQPVGLVVSLPALEKARCYVDRNVVREQQALIALVAPKNKAGEVSASARVTDLRALCRDVLGWEDGNLVDPPESLVVALPEYGEFLKPTYVVVAPGEGARHVALVSVVSGGTDFDEARTHRGWQASPQARLERLLRAGDVSIGLLFNGAQLRLVYAPRGESAGHITFNVLPMCEPAGRPILGAMHMLLSGARLFWLPEPHRLPAILQDSRRYQSDVSTALSEQVLAALYELVRGFQDANAVTRGELLGEVLREEPNHVYGGLLATLLRLVFLLYAEDWGLLPQDSLYRQSYSVTALYDKLREDAARHPGTMDHRFGAWARLLALFRLIHDGCGHGALHLPSRHGRLFDPDSYPFLEGRPYREARQVGVRLRVPRVSDGVVYRVLEKLLLLAGDRLSYRALDVEQIGSVYEAMMGFSIEVATEPSIALRGRRKPGTPAADPVVGLTALLAATPLERLKLLDEAGVDLTGKVATAIGDAKVHEEIVAAFVNKVSPFTPEVIPTGHMVLTPTEERRRSGSHYTPRALTERIVVTTLGPLFDAMGDDPTPEQIVAIKVCDPTMGSGAFLVAACRALGDKLVAAWQRHRYLEWGDDGQPPRVLVPADEDPVLHARRIVAQRCLYGVDKNPFAVDLARLSLWLVTLARGHSFTFLDHALRQGDSLVGLSRDQIATFHFRPSMRPSSIHEMLDDVLTRARHLRARIQEMGDSDDTHERQRLLQDADAALAMPRRVANLVVDAFFEGKNAKEREARLAAYRRLLETRGIAGLPDAPAAEKLTPFHWEIEFPEVFSARATACKDRRDTAISARRAGFDAFVGNPPFLGGSRLTSANGARYTEWLSQTFPGAGGQTDLCAYLFRRCATLSGEDGTVGLLATNSIGQGDTRLSGLKALLAEGFFIYCAERDLVWPGSANVIVSLVFMRAPPGTKPPRALLNGRRVDAINSRLWPAHELPEARRLRANADVGRLGVRIDGPGFIVGADERRRLVEQEPANAEILRPYVGGDELNDMAILKPQRWVIDFGARSLVEARRWPLLLRIVEERVRTAREPKFPEWWRFEGGSRFPSEDDGRTRFLAATIYTKHLAFSLQRANVVLNSKIFVIFDGSAALLAILQSRAHAEWAWLMSSTLKTDLAYSSTDCFETFPFPSEWRSKRAIEAIGEEYDAFRSTLMREHGEGLTATYNRFHDPDERDSGIHELRRLHDAMDRVVLDAYGWNDLAASRSDFVCDAVMSDSGDVRHSNHPRSVVRFRPPIDVRDQVLARLLALNAQRADGEQAARRRSDRKLTPRGRAIAEGSRQTSRP